MAGIREQQRQRRRRFDSLAAKFRDEGVVVGGGVNRITGETDFTQVTFNIEDLERVFDKIDWEKEE